MHLYTELLVPEQFANQFTRKVRWPGAASYRIYPIRPPLVEKAGALTEKNFKQVDTEWTF
jgi:hypothetical protein